MSATPYTGKARPPASQDAPSPAPGPGVAPIVNIPADTDANNVATRLLQQTRAAFDGLAHVNAAVRLCPSATPSSISVGYTAVTYSTSPAFGATVAPTGEGSTFHSRSGTNFVILCTLGGAVATAKFKTSTDGGATFGAEQTTAASMTDATTGITLAFVGTLALNGTAQFHSAFTPQAAWVDSLGNIRHVVSFTGQPMGRRSEIREEHQPLTASFSSTQNPIPNNPGRILTVTGTGSLLFLDAQTGPPALPARAIQLAPGATATNGVNYSTVKLVDPGQVPLIEFDFEFAMSAVGANNSNWRIGLNEQNAYSGSFNQVFIKKLQTNTNWFFCYQNPAGTGNPTGVDTGIPPVANTVQKFKIVMYPIAASSPYGQRAILLFIDDKFAGGFSTALLPGLSSNKPVLVSVDVNTNATAAADSGYLGPWMVSFPRWTTSPLL